MKIKFWAAFLMIYSFLTVTAWAVTVRNKTSEAIIFEAGWVILPAESAELSDAEIKHPVVRKLIASGKLELETEKPSPVPGTSETR